MLTEQTLFGERNKVDIAIARIREFEPMALRNNPAGYYVCISGGKDSAVIQALCIMAGVKCEFAHNHTSVDYPETVYFVRQEQERMLALGFPFRINIPRFPDGRQKTMWNLIPIHGLPTRLVRWCCQEFKEGGGKGRYLITGVRWAESTKRKGRGLHEVRAAKIENRIVLNNDNEMKRRMVESCLAKRSLFLNPIIDWSTEEVWDFIRQYKLPYNPLYAKGYKRVGCIGCPMSTQSMKELENNPRYKAAYFKAAEKWLEHRKEKGHENYGYMGTTQAYFGWWLSGKNGEFNKTLL
jgi:phosphoadenosine phosphosulfate reductase